MTCLLHMHFSLFHGLLQSSVDNFCWNMLRFWSHLSCDHNLRNTQWNLPPLGSDPWLIRSESGTWRFFFRIRISCHHWDILKWSESDLLLEAGMISIDAGQGLFILAWLSWLGTLHAMWNVAWEEPTFHCLNVSLVFNVIFRPSSIVHLNVSGNCATSGPTLCNVGHSLLIVYWTLLAWFDESPSKSKSPFDTGGLWAFCAPDRVKPTSAWS